MRAIIVLVALLLAGCCSTPRCYVGRALTAFEGVDRLALPAIDVACTAKIKECGSVPAAQCSAYGQCTNALTAYRAAMDATGRTLATVNRLLADLGVK